MKIRNLGIYFKNFSTKNKKAKCLTYDNVNFNYGQVDEISDKIALFLKKKGLKEFDRISIESKKDLFSFSLVIACLKLGVTYNFFDINDAKNRVENILKVVKPKIIFFYQSNFQSNTYKIQIDNKFKKKILSNKLKTKIKYLNNKNYNAYIMFTSGSTGVPKGVVISHKNLTYFIKWVKVTFKINTKSISSNLNPLHFDNSVFDIYGSLFNGSSLIPIEKNELFDPKSLMKKLYKNNCDTWFSVPSLLDLILKLGKKNLFKKNKFRNLIFGGERFPIQSVKKIFPYLKKTRVFNVSGPTECTCMCSAYKVKKNDLKNDDIYVGKINNYFKYKIINERLKKDKTGELYLEGPAVSSGYYKDTFKTKKNFYKLNNFFGYKTGDIVQENKSKLIKIIGRNDNQIKFLGHRIELEEIEKVFIKVFKIKNCIAKLKDKDIFPYKKIVIFTDKKFKNFSMIKKKINKNLPSYMVPEEFIYVKKFVYNNNGKLDRVKY